MIDYLSPLPQYSVLEYALTSRVDYPGRGPPFKVLTP